MKLLMKMVMLLLIIMRVVGRCVMVVKIMTSSMCLFGLEESPPLHSLFSVISHRLTLYLSLSLSPQIDLEPEGKVYVVIDLSGSSTEGINTTTQCFTNEKDTSEHTCVHTGLCFEDAGMCWIKVTTLIRTKEKRHH